MEERDDCHWVVARVIVREDLERATEICGTLAALGRDECFFILAEELMRAELCPQAGRFEKSCRIHIFGRRLQERAPPGTRPSALEPLAMEQMHAVGAPMGDYPFWIAAYDGLFMRDRSLTAGDCDGTTTEVSKRACLNAAGGGLHKPFNYEEDSQPEDFKKPDD